MIIMRNLMVKKQDDGTWNLRIVDWEAAHLVGQQLSLQIPEILAYNGWKAAYHPDIRTDVKGKTGRVDDKSTTTPGF